MVGIPVSFWDALFSSAMLLSGRVCKGYSLRFRVWHPEIFCCLNKHYVLPMVKIRFVVCRCAMVCRTCVFFRRKTKPSKKIPSSWATHDGVSTFSTCIKLSHFVYFQKRDTVDSWNLANQLRLVVYPIIYRVSAPSQVVVWDFSQQQYHRSPPHFFPYVTKQYI